MNRVTSRRKRDVVDCLRAVFLLQWHNCMLLCDISSTAVGKLLCHRRRRRRECPNLRCLVASSAVWRVAWKRSLARCCQCIGVACLRGCFSVHVASVEICSIAVTCSKTDFYTIDAAQAKAVAVIRFLTHGYLRDDDSNTYVSSANVVKVLKWKRLKI